MKKILISGFLLLGLVVSSAWASQQFMFVGPDSGGYLGIHLRDVEMDEFRGLGLAEAAGVVVEEVIEGTPAEKAGLQVGDVIVEYAGIKVISARQFRRLVGETPPNRQVSLALLRGGARMSVEPVISESEKGFSWKGDLPGIEIPPHFEHKMDPIDPQTFRFHPFAVPDSKVQLGVGAVDLTPQLADHLGVNAGKGILVMEVLKDTPAEKAGIQAGDVITKVDGSVVATLSDLRKALHEGQNTVEFVRKGRVETLTAEIGEANKSSSSSIKM